MSDEFTSHFTDTKLNLNESCQEVGLRARSSAWLERSTDNRKVMCSNHIGPILFTLNFQRLFLTIEEHLQIFQILNQIGFLSFFQLFRIMLIVFVFPIFL